METIIASLQQFHQAVKEKKPNSEETSDFIDQWCQDKPLTPYSFVDNNLYSWSVNLVSRDSEEVEFSPFEESMTFRLMSVPPEQLLAVISASSDKLTDQWAELITSLTVDSFKPILVACALQLGS
jgi:hypothetical protein